MSCRTISKSMPTIVFIASIHRACVAVETGELPMRISGLLVSLFRQPCRLADRFGMGQAGRFHAPSTAFVPPNLSVSSPSRVRRPAFTLRCGLRRRLDRPASSHCGPGVRAAGSQRGPGAGASARSEVRVSGNAERAEHFWSAHGHRSARRSSSVWRSTPDTGALPRPAEWVGLQRG
jgi:hypothetical protein